MTFPTHDNHWRWLGEKAKYSAKHKWVNKNLGRPKECSECNFTSDNSRQFHWANISGEYKRGIYDWKRLCVKCHKKFDGYTFGGRSTKVKSPSWIRETCNNGHRMTLNNLYLLRHCTIECRVCRKERRYKNNLIMRGI